MKIVTKTGHEIEIDDEDWDLVRGYTWRAEKHQRESAYYARATKSIGGKTVNIKMHRLILGAQPGQLIHHKDKNGLNNTRKNMCFATWRQIMADRSKRRGCVGSRFKGVSWHPRAKAWRARICRLELGFYETEEDAALAYDRAAEWKYRKFARLNFPASKRVPVSCKMDPALGRLRNGQKTSRYLGVCWHERDRRWRAQYRGRYLGAFENENDARAVYLKACPPIQPFHLLGQTNHHLTSTL
jgi:hypothetical protein